MREERLYGAVGLEPTALQQLNVTTFDERVTAFDEQVTPSTVRTDRTRRWVTPTMLLIDMLAVAAAMAVAWKTRTSVAGPDDLVYRGAHPLLSAASLPFWAILFSHFRLYQERFLVRGVEELRRVVSGVVCGALSVALLSYMSQQYVTRGWLLLTVVFGIIFVGFERFAIRRAIGALRRRGRLVRPVIIVGANIEAIAMCSMLARERWRGYDVIGFVDDTEPIGAEVFESRHVLGSVDDARAIASAHPGCGVLIATTSVDYVTTNRLARELLECGVRVEVSSSLQDIAPERLLVRPLGGFSVVDIDPVRRGGWRRVAKRLTDVTIASICLLALVPFLPFVLLVKLGSPGPILFIQERVGRDGRLFRLYKLRTMVVDAEERREELALLNEADGPLFKIKFDPRITKVGAVLRRYSIDELPQLLNVLRGDMSLVGPRPALPNELSGWSPELYGRLRVKPGVTGMWQVNGRSSSSFEDYSRLDLYYVDNWSLVTDLAVLARTVPALVLRRGAC